MVELKPADYDPLVYGGDATVMRTPWLWKFAGGDLMSLVAGLGLLACFFLPWVSYYDYDRRVTFTGLDVTNQIDSLRFPVVLLIPSAGALFALRGFAYPLIRAKGVSIYPHGAVSMILGGLSVAIWYLAGVEAGKPLLRNHGVHILFNAELAFYATMFFAGLGLAAAIGEAVEHVSWKRSLRKGVEERSSKFGMVTMPDVQLPDGVAKALGLQAATAAAGIGPAPADFGGAAGGSGMGAQGMDTSIPPPADWGGQGGQGGPGYDQGGYPQGQWGAGEGAAAGGGYDQGQGGGWQQPPMDPKQRKAWEKQMRKMQKDQEKARKKGGGGKGTPDFSYGGSGGQPPQF